MTNLPKISIVTPSFNQGRYIEQTILSVLDQNYPDLEYIIIDGGSTDETVEIIRKYEKHLSYWVSEKDEGQTDAINKGFEKCTGEIFNWINSDDYYDPGALLKIGQLFKENNHTEVVCGKEWSFNDANPQERSLNAGSIIKRNVFETIQIGIIDQPCTFFRKKVIDVLFPLDTTLHYVMDRQLWWGYLLKNGQDNILETNEVFTNFRLHAQSKSVSISGLLETEFESLKLSLFYALNAPAILIEQLPGDTKPANVSWQIDIDRALILASFASFFAERCYVKDNLELTSQLMKYVKDWRQGKLTPKEKKLWIASNIIPHSLIMGMKKIKNTINIL